jgi:arylsulfatase A-like enzyme
VVTSNGELRAGKGTHYEGGVRVAAFANWPGVIPAGSKIDEPLHMVDWYPTLLRVAGATVDQKLPLDGRDIWPTLVEGKPTPHEHLLINATPVSGAIRAGDWKLVVNGALANAGFDGQRNEVVSGDPRLELFDLSQDISETTNLASRYPERANELLAVFRQYQGEATPPTAEPKGKGYKSPAIWGDFND